MSRATASLRSPRIKEAVADLKRRIAERYPDATFSVFKGEDPEGIYLRASVDVEDLDDVLDVVIDRLVELGDDEIPVYVIPVRPFPDPGASLRPAAKP